MAHIRNLRIRSVVRPLKTLFSTALGSKTHIHNVFVTVLLDDGASGTGEVPTSFSAPHETVDVVRRVLREVSTEIAGLPIDGYKEKVEEFRRRFFHTRMTISGLEVALFRAHLASQGGTEFAYWGGSGPCDVESDITVPFSTDPDSIRRWVNKAAGSGFRYFKLKVSGDPGRDISFVTLVQSLLADQLTGFGLRLDGNQGFTAESLLRFNDMLEKREVAVELFEQPLPKDDFRGQAHVRERLPFPVILDEGVFSVETMNRAVESGAGSGVNIKVAKSGISESRKIIEIARREKMRLMAGCMVETMTGLSAAVYLAGGTDAFDYVDLDSIHFLWHRRRYGDISVAASRYSIG